MNNSLFSVPGTQYIPCSVCDIFVREYAVAGQDNLCLACYAWLVYYLYEVARMWKSAMHELVQKVDLTVGSRWCDVCELWYDTDDPCKQH